MEASTFDGILDRYNGITVDSRKETSDSCNFNIKLSESLQKWNKEGRRCIWFKVHIKDADWVPLLAKERFNFHHSRENFVMMFKWLPKNSTPNLPPSCHTNIGVGGLVFNDENQILVVSEQHYDYPHWKLPGGYVEKGEDIKDAAVREVKEETGIDAVFNSMITLRHTHKMMFGNSDIYILVSLKATSNVITKSDEEILACKWMDVEEYLNHPHVYEFNKFILEQALDLKARNIKLSLHKKKVTIAQSSREITSLIIDDL